MAKIDRIRADIGFHEKMFFAGLAIIIGLIGWTWSNNQAVEVSRLGIALLGLFIACIFNIYQYRITVR